MYERFSDRARKVMQFAQTEAIRFNHEYVGSEHILLGLVKEGHGVASGVLNNLEVDLRKIRLDVEMLIKSGPTQVTMGRLPQTPLAKKVIELAIDESRKLAHQYVGTDHLLLGLLLATQGVACQVLNNLGLTYERVRDAMKAFVASEITETEADNQELKNGLDAASIQETSKVISKDWTCSIRVVSHVATERTGLFVIRSCATSGDGKQQYWSCSTEHGTGWCSVPKQSFTKSELSGQVFDIIEHGHFQDMEIIELRVPQ